MTRHVGDASRADSLLAHRRHLREGARGALDRKEDIYVVDTLNRRVQKLVKTKK